ncbi:MAG: SPFH domain-containing protein [Steroidobacteraceae bacterium]
MKSLRLMLIVALLALIAVPLLCVRVLDSGTLGLRLAGTQLLGVLREPGVYFFSPAQHLVRLDERSQLTLLTGEPLRSASNEDLLVDVGAQWRISDVQRYFAATGADAASAAQQLKALLRTQLPLLLGGHSYEALAHLDAAQFDADALRQVSVAAAQLGMNVQRLDLVRVEPADSLAMQMRTGMAERLPARARALTEQATGEQARLRAAAEAHRDQVLVEGAAAAGRIRGEGDAQAAAVYDRAYGKNPEFAAFYRSLQAYRKVLGRDGDLLVITPDGAFFRYLRNPDQP